MASGQSLLPGVFRIVLDTKGILWCPYLTENKGKRARLEIVEVVFAYVLNIKGLEGWNLQLCENMTLTRGWSRQGLRGLVSR